MTHVDLISWQEKINGDNAAEYMGAAMGLVAKLTEDLDISQELVRELLEQIVEVEDRYVCE